MRKASRGEIVKISSLFEVYRKRLKAPEKSVILVCIEVINDVLGVSLKETWCAYSPQTRMLKLSVPGTLKTEIMLHKNEILTHVQGRLGERSAPQDIL